MNLAKLPKEQRDDIEKDKQRSLKCSQWLKEMPRWKIRALVENMPEPEKQLHRDTLNRMIRGHR